jgi:hypothetical protein
MDLQQSGQRTPAGRCYDRCCKAKPGRAATSGPAGEQSTVYQSTHVRNIQDRNTVCTTYSTRVVEVIGLQCIYSTSPAIVSCLSALAHAGQRSLVRSVSTGSVWSRFQSHGAHSRKCKKSSQTGRTMSHQYTVRHGRLYASRPEHPATRTHTTEESLTAAGIHVRNFLVPCHAEVPRYMCLDPSVISFLLCRLYAHLVCSGPSRTDGYQCSLHETPVLHQPYRIRS